MEDIGPGESALLVPVSATVPVVDRWRERLDPSAARGVPAHVTVLYPFVPPERIDTDLITDLTEIVGSVPSFPFDLHTVNWFGDEVVWLGPEPDAPFREITALVTERWPDFPPYGGVFADVVPHLTVGEGAPIEHLKDAARQLAIELPIRCFAREVWLMTGSRAPNSWTEKAAFRLGRPLD